MPEMPFSPLSTSIGEAQGNGPVIGQRKALPDCAFDQ